MKSLETNVCGPAARRPIPLVSFDMDGVLCNIQQSWLDIATELDATRIHGWQDLSCTHTCDTCKSSVCLAPGDSGLDKPISRAYLARIKAAALSTPDHYTTIEPFSPEDLEIIRYSIQSYRILAVFVATRPHPVGEMGDYPMDADAQSLAWLEGSWASQYLRETYALTGHLGGCFSALDKVSELLHRGVQYHIDDNPGTVELLRKAGIEAFLLDRPWNQREICEWRVDSIEQFLDIVAPSASGVTESPVNTVSA